MAAAFVPASPWRAPTPPLGGRRSGPCRPRRRAAAAHSTRRRPPPRAAAAASASSSASTESAAAPADGGGGGGSGGGGALSPPPSRFVVTPLTAGAPAGAVHTVAALRAGAFAPFPTAAPDEARRSVAAILTRQLASTVPCSRGRRRQGGGSGGRGSEDTEQPPTPTTSPAYALVTLLDATPPPSLAGWISATGVGGLPVAAVDVEVYGPAGEVRSVGWLLDELRAGDAAEGPAGGPPPASSSARAVHGLPAAAAGAWAGAAASAAPPPPAPDEWVYLSSMAVDGEYRRQGLARLLLTTVLAAVARARRGGHADGRGGGVDGGPPPLIPPRPATGGVALHVRPDNAPARRLYERAGFVAWHPQARRPPGAPPPLPQPPPPTTAASAVAAGAPAWLVSLAADGDLLLRLDEGGG